MSEIMRARLREEMERQAISAFALSRKAGLGRTFVRDFLAGTSRSPRADSLAAIAGALGVSSAWLAGESESRKAAAASLPAAPEIPVYGTAAGSKAGAMQLGDDPIEWVPRPPGLAGARDVYCLYVTGSSMEPRYRQGDLIFVSPHRPPRIGDDIVVQSNENGGVEAFLKVFSGRRDGDVIGHQFNPVDDVVFKARHIIAMHRVLRLEELMGL